MDFDPKIMIIDDEFSAMTDDEYAAALAAWLAEVEACEPIELPVTAAETLREVRQHGES